MATIRSLKRGFLSLSSEEQLALVLAIRESRRTRKFSTKKTKGKKAKKDKAADLLTMLKNLPKEQQEAFLREAGIL